MRLRTLILLLILPLWLNAQTYSLYDRDVIGTLTKSGWSGDAPSASRDTTNFYFAIDGVADSTGNDTNYPTTLATIQAGTYEPGDSIFAKKGDIWRLTSTWGIPWIGEIGNNITLTSYGSGDKPKFVGSDTITMWTQVGATDVWWGYKLGLDNAALATSRLFFELLTDTVAWGIPESDIGSIDAVYEYYENNDTIYVYSTSDPSSAFGSIEIPQINNLIAFLGGASDSSEYVTIDGLEIAYSYDGLLRSAYPGGTNSGRELKGVEVRNCHIHHCDQKNGGRAVQLFFSSMIIEDNEINDGGRTNIALTPDPSFNGDYLRNISIQDNYIHDGFHNTGAGIIPTKNGLTIDSVVFARNIIEDNRTNYDFLSHGVYIDDQSAGGGTIKNIRFENNLFLNTKGNAIFMADPDSTYIIGNTFFGMNPDVPDYTGGFIMGPSTAGARLVMKNNIFHLHVNDNYNYCWRSNGTQTDADVDYNLYYHPTSNEDLVYYNGTGYNTSEWAAYQAASSQDANSQTPVYPDIDTTGTYPFTYPDWSPNIGSPAIDSGTTILITDYYGTTRGVNTDIGAIEDVDPPLWVTAEIGAYDDSIIVVTLDKALNSDSVPPISAISVKEGNAVYTVEAITISGVELHVAMDSPANSDSTHTISYTPDFPKLQNNDGNLVVAWVDSTVRNGNPLTRNLVASYAFEEVSGPALDETPNNNDGTTTNVTYGTAGIIGDCYTYDGTAYVDVGALLTNTTFSISLWVYTDAGSNTHTFIGNSRAGGGGMEIWINSGNEKGELLKSATVAIGEQDTQIPDGAWRHLIITYDGTNWAFYYQGAADGSGSSAQTFDAGDVWIGAKNGGDSFEGEIDELRIWMERLLDADDALEIFTLEELGIGYPWEQ